MKTIKHLISAIAFIVIAHFNISAQDVLISVIPNNPTIEDEVKVCTNVYFFSVGSYQTHTLIWAGDNHLIIDLYYSQSGQAMPTNFYDTISIGQLSEGLYTVIANLKVKAFNAPIDDLSKYYTEDSDTVIFRVNEALNIPEYDEKVNDLSIYPNPTDDILNVHFSSSLAQPEIEIYNLEGRLVYRQKNIQSNQQDISIEISQFSKGVYLFTLKDKNNMITKKFIKQ